MWAQRRRATTLMRKQGTIATTSRRQGCILRWPPFLMILSSQTYPKKPALSDVDTLISLELGSAMRITVLKLDGTSLDVVVMNSATVKDLKLAIKKKINDMEQSKMGHRQISWKHVWSNFCLSYHNEKLIDDNSALQEHGVRNNSQVQFFPYVMSRASRRHSRRRKHCFFHGLNKRG